MNLVYTRSSTCEYIICCLFTDITSAQRHYSAERNFENRQRREHHFNTSQDRLQEYRSRSVRSYNNGGNQAAQPHDQNCHAYNVTSQTAPTYAGGQLHFSSGNVSQTSRFEHQHQRNEYTSVQSSSSDNNILGSRNYDNRRRRTTDIQNSHRPDSKAKNANLFYPKYQNNRWI